MTGRMVNVTGGEEGVGTVCASTLGGVYDQRRLRSGERTGNFIGKIT